MLKYPAISVLLFSATSLWASAEQLRREAEQFTGSAVRLDVRLPVPACDSGFAFRQGGAKAARLEATCPETGWRMSLPVVASAPAALPRRGQRLRVEVEGQGYRATVDGIVETAHERQGTIIVRNARSGTRFMAHVDADGRILAFSSGRPLKDGVVQP